MRCPLQAVVIRNIRDRASLCGVQRTSCRHLLYARICYRWSLLRLDPGPRLRRYRLVHCERTRRSSSPRRSYRAQGRYELFHAPWRSAMPLLVSDTEVERGHRADRNSCIFQHPQARFHDAEADPAAVRVVRALDEVEDAYSRGGRIRRCSRSHLHCRTSTAGHNVTFFRGDTPSTSMDQCTHQKCLPSQEKLIVRLDTRRWSASCSGKVDARGPYFGAREMK